MLIWCFDWLKGILKSRIATREGFHAEYVGSEELQRQMKVDAILRSSIEQNSDCPFEGFATFRSRMSVRKSD
jgi:hypothetical protein